MNDRITYLKKLSIGIAVLAAPTTIGLATLSNVYKPEKPLYANSNYIKEKGYLNCKDKCSELSAGYEWAKTNNACDATYDKGTSMYNIGVHAWAWDECAYSRDGQPI